MQPGSMRFFPHNTSSLPACAILWDQPFSVVPLRSGNGNLMLMLHSNGPDKRSGSKDAIDVTLANWSWFGIHQQQLRGAAVAYYIRTHSYIRDLAALRDEMQHEHIDFEAWRDPWGNPFTYTVTISEAVYLINAFSKGDRLRLCSYQQPPYAVGSAAVDYFPQSCARAAAKSPQPVRTHAPVSAQ